MRSRPGKPALHAALPTSAAVALLLAVFLALPACVSTPTSQAESTTQPDSASPESASREYAPLPTPRLPPDPVPPAPAVAESGQAAEATDHDHTTQEPAGERFYLKPFHYMIKQHREVGTHIDGPRCPMYPSCGAYADRIIREGGFYGLILFIDRLFYREFGRLSDRYMVAPRSLSKSPRYYDPVTDVLPDASRGGEHRPSFFREDFRN